MFLGLQQRMGACESGKGAGLVVLQAPDRSIGPIAQRRGMRQAPVLRIELIPFASRWRQFVDFADLPLQALTLLLPTGLGLAGLLQCFLIRAPLCPPRGGLRGP